MDDYLRSSLHTNWISNNRGIQISSRGRRNVLCNGTFGCCMRGGGMAKSHQGWTALWNRFGGGKYPSAELKTQGSWKKNMPSTLRNCNSCKWNPSGRTDTLEHLAEACTSMEIVHWLEVGDLVWSGRTFCDPSDRYYATWGGIDFAACGSIEIYATCSIGNKSNWSVMGHSIFNCYYSILLWLVMCMVYFWIRWWLDMGDELGVIQDNKLRNSDDVAKRWRGKDWWPGIKFPSLASWHQSCQIVEHVNLTHQITGSIYVASIYSQGFE